MDELLEFADAESVIDASGDTQLLGDVIDLGAGGTGFHGKQMYLVISVDTEVDSAMDGATIQFQLASDAAAGIATNGDASVHVDTGAIAETALVEGAMFVFPVPPSGGVDAFERYLGILQTTGGENVTAGAVNAFLTMDAKYWKAYADGDN